MRVWQIQHTNGSCDEIHYYCDHLKFQEFNFLKLMRFNANLKKAHLSYKRNLISLEFLHLESLWHEDCVRYYEIVFDQSTPNDSLQRTPLVFRDSLRLFLNYSNSRLLSICIGFFDRLLIDYFPLRRAISVVMGFHIDEHFGEIEWPRIEYPVKNHV